jgi:hypothetical protein
MAEEKNTSGVDKLPLSFFRMKVFRICLDSELCEVLDFGNLI